LFDIAGLRTQLSRGGLPHGVAAVGNIERVIVVALSMAAIVAAASFLKLMFFTHGIDTAGMVDLVGNIAHGRGMVSSAFSSFYSIWDLLNKPPDIYCQDAFSSLFADANFALWHPYLIAYPMAALTWVPGFDALTVTTLMLATSLIGGLAALYWFLRRQGCAVGPAILFVAVVFLFQPWSGNLAGQFYFDRLFFLPALVLIFTVHERLTTGRGSWVAIVLSAAACMAISERPAIMCGAFLIAYTVLWHGPAVWRSRDARLLIGLGLCAFVYVGLYAIFVQNSKYYSSFGIRNFLYSIDLVLGVLRLPSEKMIAVLLPMLILSIFSWRAGLVAVGAIIPNFLITVGGAEKTGFLTHYHSPYLPFVVAAAGLGLLRLDELARRPEGMRKLAGQAALGGVLVAAGAYGHHLDSANLTRPFAFTATPDQTQFVAVLPTDQWPLIQSIKFRRDFLQRVAAEIPMGASVSSSDWVMPALVDRGIKLVDYAPIGLGARDFVIMEYLGGTSLPVVPSYLAGEDLRSIQRCVEDRVRATYEPIREVKNPGSSFVIFAPRNK
jgi:hypothetical protein